MLNSSALIYNVDETGIPLDPKAPNVVAKTGTEKVQFYIQGRTVKLQLLCVQVLQVKH